MARVGRAPRVGVHLRPGPTPEAAVATAARRIGPMGGWRAGPHVEHKVFAREVYPERARPGDYTRSVITAR